MELIKSENYETHLCNFYEDNHNEVWLTREQVGAALGYADPAKSIQNIHLKHKERLDKFIKREKVKTSEIGDSHEHPQSDGGRERSQNKHLQSEVVFYSERGVMEICRWSDMPNANQFMDWVWDIVEAYRRNEIVANKRAIELLNNQFNSLAKSVEESTEAVKQLREEVFSHIDLLEEKGELGLSPAVEWANEMMVHVRKIVEKYPGMDQKKCMDRLVERSEDYMYETYETLLADYALHHDGKKAKKILVMARDEDTRDAFERAVKDYEIDAGIYEQNEGQKYVEKLMEHMGEMIVPDPPVYQHKMTDEELAEQWAEMDKMYGPGWDAPPERM